MGNSIGGDGILERLRNVTLSNHILKTLRSPLSSQNQIGHQRILKSLPRVFTFPAFFRDL
jgi:hypothetical protein